MKTHGCKANVGRIHLTKHFDHRAEEASIYSNWENTGAFAPSGEGQPFFIPMPPPNITGILHMGHALFATLQDITIRHKRMTGHRTLWLPGTDHAGMATQTKLDEMMLLEGLDPSGPDFDSFAETYKQNLTSTITTQIRRIGASCDWSRSRFTMDDQYTESVIAALEKCHDAGMLYQQGGQWWLDMTPLSEKLLEHLGAGDIDIIPNGGNGVLVNFLSKIEPWCISRQIRWGHRLPIWMRRGEIIISKDCPGEGFIQEEGCLDTWFSSALWPFATLGWPNQTSDLEDFYPAAMIETADDILFFWVARMMMMGLLLTDKLPFKTIFLHGLIRDKYGRKMSKSLGNGIDPLDIIEEYGTDGMRFTLARNATPGRDINLDPKSFQYGKQVTTKLWNASKYALAHFKRMGGRSIEEPTDGTPEDQKMASTAIRYKDQIRSELDSLRYHEAAQLFRDFLFEELCGGYIEQSKSRLYDDNDPRALQTLMFCLDQMLIMGHPFMPFITERVHSLYSDAPLISRVC